MWMIMYLVPFAIIMLLIVAIVLQNALLLNISICGVALIALYWTIKLAVKSALREYDREKEQPSGQK